MEKLEKSPLAYVIAQVRIGAVQKMAEYIDDIQEQMRKAGYPIFRPSEVQELEFGPAGTKTKTSRKWTFGCIAGNTGFSIQTGAIAFHTTAYDTHTKFFEELKKGLDIVHAVVDISATERLGLRYVDVFQAGEGRDLESYLQEGLRSVSLDGIGARRQRFFSNLVMDTDVGGRLVVRIALDPDDGLPPNLLPADLKPMRRIEASSPVCVLDYDHFIEKTETFNVDQVMTRFAELHGIVKNAFLKTVSESALESWK